MRLALVLALRAAAPDGAWTTLQHGDEEISVYRDSWGIPHIFAKSPRGAFWAEGFLEAEDRLWQMETFRRAARGQAAEIQGKSALANDRDRARSGYTGEELGKLVEAGSPKLRE